MKGSMKCPVDGSALKMVGSHGIVDYENRWDAETTKYACEKGHVIFVADEEAVSDEDESKQTARRKVFNQNVTEIREVLREAIENVQKSFDNYWKGPRSEISNDDRAQWAALSIQLFAALTASTEESWETNLSDLIADLLHFCKKHNIDFHACMENGHGHYAEETAEEVLNSYTVD